MKLLRRLRRLLRIDHQQTVADEIEQHRAMVQDDLERGGMNPRDAAAASRRAMGNATLALEHSRDVWVVGWADRLWREIRIGFRSLRREPGFAFAAIATLALGVATTTTVFSVADAELWRPLPYPRPHELVAIASYTSGARRQAAPVSGADFLDWRAGASAFTDMAGFGRTSRRTMRLDVSEAVSVADVSANLLTMLGREMMAGRNFDATDTRGGRSLILTERGWDRLFDREPSAIGRTVFVDDQTLTIIGVVTTDAALGADTDGYVAVDEATPRFLDRGQGTFFDGIVGRLAPGATADVAQAQLAAIADRLAREFPSGRTNHTVEVGDMQKYYFGGASRQPLLFFLGASFVVLLLAASNIAALLLSRSFRRSREFALRGALGGGQAALARQLLVEGAWLAVPAGAIGAVLATWCVRAIAAQLPGDLLQRGVEIPVDFRAWSFAFSVTAITAAAFVLVPMFSARRIELSSALGPGARTGRSATEGRARTALLIGQIAMTLVLVFGAAIFLKSFAALTQAPLGFEPANRLTMRTTVGAPRYVTPAAVTGYVDELLAQVRAIPGVRSAAAASSSPLGSGPMALLAPTGEPAVPAGGETRAIVRTVTPGYFQTVGIPILRGREFSADDRATGPRMAIINETAARRLFGDVDAVGRRVDFRPGPRSAAWMQMPGAVLIAGVAANIKEVGVNEVEFADVYFPWPQAPASSVELIVRAAPSASIDAQALKRATAAVDPAVAVVSVSTLDQRVSRALQNDRFNMMLISSFAAIAVLLAVVGIYGAIAYAVEGRRREFGVRLALGARPRQLVSLALWQAGRVGIAGGLIGVGGALVLSRVLGDALYLVPGAHNGLLYGVTTIDPLMLAAAFVAIVALALGAGLIPARRVGRVNPMLALRNE